MERIEKDFKDLDLDAVDFYSGVWSWGRGGLPLQDDEYFVSYSTEALVETRYKLPRFFCEMLVIMKEAGKLETQSQIQHALGL